MQSFFWPEYSCNTQSQIIITEDAFKDNSSVTYLEEFDPANEPQATPA